MSDYPIKSPRKLIEVALPLDAINKACARKKIHPAWASFHATSVVGTAAAGGQTIQFKAAGREMLLLSE
jgi:hypothetical protein